MDLVDFLLARIAEDEAAARAVNDWPEAPRDRRLPWEQTPSDERVLAWGLTAVAAASAPVVATHIVRWDPARALAECEAKRRIVESFREAEANRAMYGNRVTDGILYGVLWELAKPYAAHPDFRRTHWHPEALYPTGVMDGGAS